MNYITTFDSVFFYSCIFTLVCIVVSHFFTPKLSVGVVRAYVQGKPRELARSLILPVILFGLMIAGFAWLWFEGLEGFLTATFWGTVAYAPFYKKHTEYMTQKTLALL